MTTRRTQACAFTALAASTLLLSACGGSTANTTPAPSFSTVAAQTSSSAPTQAGDTSSTGPSDGQQSAAAAPTQGSTPAAASAPAAASGATYTTSVWAAFVSPSGKNMCELSTGPSVVSCRLSTTLQQQYGGTMVQLTTSDVHVLSADFGQNDDGSGSTWAFTGPTVPPMSGFDHDYVLPYGSSISGGSITCSSSTSGFTCSNGSSSFTVSSESLSMS